MSTSLITEIRAGKKQRAHRWAATLLLLAIIAAAACIALLIFGTVYYPLPVVIDVLMGEQVKGANFAIETIRLPKMLGGLFAGFAFGVSGYIFQTILRNPLANPNVIGITAGSSAAAVFCILILHSSEAFVSTASIVAGLLTVVILFLLARGPAFSIGKIVLIGIAVQAICNAMITYIMLLGREHDLAAAMRWLTGSLNGISMDDLPLLVFSTIGITLLLQLLGNSMLVLELGEQPATSLGIRTDVVRLSLIIGSVLLCAIATAVTGPLASIALLAGPIANRMAGTGRSNMLAAGLVGANLVLIAELIGQFAFTIKYPAGIITAIIGAPYLIILLIRMNRRGSF